MGGCSCKREVPDRTPAYLHTYPAHSAGGAHAVLRALFFFFFLLVFTGLTTTTYKVLFVPVAFLYDRVTPEFGFHVYSVTRWCHVHVFIFYLPFFSFRQWHDALLKIVSSSPARCYFFLFFFCLPYIVISWRSTKKKKKN